MFKVRVRVSRVSKVRVRVILMIHTMVMPRLNRHNAATAAAAGGGGGGTVAAALNF